MSRLTNSNTWNDLKNHHRQMKECSLRDLFQDSNRFLDFSIESDDFLLDFSKNIIDQQTMNLLFKLATESKIKNEIQDMFSAKEINWTEKRSVLHTALRDKSKTQILINNKDIKFDIKKSLDKINVDFLSSQMGENETLKTIKTVYEKFNIVLDPHTAIGYGAFDKVNLKGNNVVLATAHPCKFPGAIEKAINIKAQLPSELAFILNEKENYDIIDNDLNKIKQYIKERI